MSKDAASTHGGSRMAIDEKNLKSHLSLLVITVNLSSGPFAGPGNCLSSDF